MFPNEDSVRPALLLGLSVVGTVATGLLWWRHGWLMALAVYAALLLGIGLLVLRLVDRAEAARQGRRPAASPSPSLLRQPREGATGEE